MAFYVYCVVRQHSICRALLRNHFQSLRWVIVANRISNWNLIVWNLWSGVRRKLCALSLTARAQHGELPLPMPTILRRPTHMILVTGMTPNGLVQESSQDDFLSPQRSSRNSVGSENNQCGVHRLNSNRRFNGSSGSGINPLTNKNGLGTEEENRNLMAETRFRSGPRTPRYDSAINSN